MGCLLCMWMAGTWYNPGPSTPMRDVNGVVLAIGQTIKLVGTIIAMNPNDVYYGSITCQLLHPNGLGPLVGATYQIHPLQIVVGS